MNDHFKNNPLTLEELNTWNSNKLINPRTGKKIKKNGNTYNYILSVYNKLIINNDINTKQSNDVILEKLLKCHDDRDPISMNIFWTEELGNRKAVYPIDKLDDLVFYIDSKNNTRCLEKESIKYLKSYGIFINPSNNDPIPQEVFEGIETINIVEQQNNTTVSELALDVFQYFNKISIFIDYEWFLALTKAELLKLNYELGDFWLQNFSQEQKNQISSIPLLVKTNSDFNSESLENIQKYLLNQIKTLLSCENEELKYMINYIIVGALSIVIPIIKDLYPDFVFSF